MKIGLSQMRRIPPAHTRHLRPRIGALPSVYSESLCGKFLASESARNELLKKILAGCSKRSRGKAREDR